MTVVYGVISQVRCMMAVLLLIGQQLEAPEVIDQLLDVNKHPRKPQYRWVQHGISRIGIQLFCIVELILCFGMSLESPFEDGV